MGYLVLPARYTYIQDDEKSTVDDDPDEEQQHDDSTSRDAVESMIVSMVEQISHMSVDASRDDVVQVMQQYMQLQESGGSSFADSKYFSIDESKSAHLLVLLFFIMSHTPYTYTYSGCSIAS